MTKKIIVIDDEAAIRKSFELALEDSGFEVEAVDSGQKGIERIKADSFDLVFLDLKMPGMSGVETLREIRTFNAEMPVYIVTAFYGEFFDELEELVAEGVQFEVLQKPVDSEKINLVCQGVLEGPVVFED